MHDRKSDPKPSRTLPENAVGFRVKIGPDGQHLVAEAGAKQALRPAKPSIPNTFSYWAYRSL